MAVNATPRNLISYAESRIVDKPAEVASAKKGLMEIMRKDTPTEKFAKSHEALLKDVRSGDWLVSQRKLQNLEVKINNFEREFAGGDVQDDNIRNNAIKDLVFLRQLCVQLKAVKDGPNKLNNDQLTKIKDLEEKTTITSARVFKTGSGTTEFTISQTAEGIERTKIQRGYKDAREAKAKEEDYAFGQVGKGVKQTSDKKVTREFDDKLSHLKDRKHVGGLEERIAARKEKEAHLAGIQSPKVKLEKIHPREHITPSMLKERKAEMSQAAGTSSTKEAIYPHEEGVSYRDVTRRAKEREVQKESTSEKAFDARKAELEPKLRIHTGQAYEREKADSSKKVTREHDATIEANLAAKTELHGKNMAVVQQLKEKLTGSMKEFMELKDVKAAMTSRQGKGNFGESLFGQSMLEIQRTLSQKNLTKEELSEAVEKYSSLVSEQFLLNDSHIDDDTLKVAKDVRQRLSGIRGEAEIMQKQGILRDAYEARQLKGVEGYKKAELPGEFRHAAGIQKLGKQARHERKQVQAEGRIQAKGEQVELGNPATILTNTINNFLGTKEGKLALRSKSFENDVNNILSSLNKGSEEVKGLIAKFTSLLKDSYGEEELHVPKDVATALKVADNIVKKWKSELIDAGENLLAAFHEEYEFEAGDEELKGQYNSLKERIEHSSNEDLNKLGQDILNFFGQMMGVMGQIKVETMEAYTKLKGLMQ